MPKYRDEPVIAFRTKNYQTLKNKKAGVVEKIIARIDWYGEEIKKEQDRSDKIKLEIDIEGIHFIKVLSLSIELSNCVQNIKNHCNQITDLNLMAEFTIEANKIK